METKNLIFSPTFSSNYEIPLGRQSLKKKNKKKTDDNVSMAWFARWPKERSFALMTLKWYKAGVELSLPYKPRSN